MTHEEWIMAMRAFIADGRRTLAVTPEARAEYREEVMALIMQAPEMQDEPMLRLVVDNTKSEDI